MVQIFSQFQSHKRKMHCKFGCLLHEIPDEQSFVLKKEKP